MSKTPRRASKSPRTPGTPRTRTPGQSGRSVVSDLSGDEWSDVSDVEQDEKMMDTATLWRVLQTAKVAREVEPQGSVKKLEPAVPHVEVEELRRHVAELELENKSLRGVVEADQLRQRVAEVEQENQTLRVEAQALREERDSLQRQAQEHRHWDRIKELNEIKEYKEGWDRVDEIQESKDHNRVEYRLESDDEDEDNVQRISTMAQTYDKDWRNIGHRVSMRGGPASRRGSTASVVGGGGGGGALPMMQRAMTQKSVDTVGFRPSMLGGHDSVGSRNALKPRENVEGSGIEGWAEVAQRFGTPEQVAQNFVRYEREIHYLRSVIAEYQEISVSSSDRKGQHVVSAES